MTEDQFKTLENFLKDELRKQTEQEALAGKELSDFVSTKELVLKLRQRLGITRHIHALVFEQADSSIRVINFYNQVKRVIIRSGGVDRQINLKVFINLIHELRIKLDITKAGMAAEKTMRIINFGLETQANDKSKGKGKGGRSSKGDKFLSNRCLLKRQQRIERIVL